MSGRRLCPRISSFLQGEESRKTRFWCALTERDYELALSREKAALAQAEFQLKVEQGRKEVAEYEWTLMDKKNQPTGARKGIDAKEPPYRE